MGGAGADNPPGDYLAPFRDEVSQNLGIFIVNTQLFVCTESTNFPS
jgi:hypothetical protein